MYFYCEKWPNKSCWLFVALECKSDKLVPRSLTFQKPENELHFSWYAIFAICPAIFLLQEAILPCPGSSIRAL